MWVHLWRHLSKILPSRKFVTTPILHRHTIYHYSKTRYRCGDSYPWLIFLIKNIFNPLPPTDSSLSRDRLKTQIFGSGNLLKRIKFLFQIPGALLVLPAATGELFWSAAVLSALGSTLAVIIGLPLNATIIVSGKFKSFFMVFHALKHETTKMTRVPIHILRIPWPF